MRRTLFARSALALSFSVALVAQAAVLVGLLWLGLDGAWLAGLIGAALLCTGFAALLVAGELRYARRRIKEAKRTLEEAIDALPASVEIFDQQDRLVAFNQRLVEIYPHMLGAFKRGASFEELVRVSLARGGVPAAVGREEAWLAERLAARSKQREPLLQRVHDER